MSEIYKQWLRVKAGVVSADCGACGGHAAGLLWSLNTKPHLQIKTEEAVERTETWSSAWSLSVVDSTVL